MAEQADAGDLKSSVPKGACGFESLLPRKLGWLRRERFSTAVLMISGLNNSAEDAAAESEESRETGPDISSLSSAGKSASVTWKRS